MSIAPEAAALDAALAGRYVVERELGRGGMGVVYLARDVALERPVAIKVLPPALARDAEVREGFLREARTAAGLSHPNVVSIHLVEAKGDVVFFVMTYIDGETLAQRVRRGGPLPLGEALRLLQEVAWALGYAHGRGVVHRDVKPENILLERATGRAMVSDFGIAQRSDGLGRRGEVIGTAHFMSPEQAQGEPVDARSDLYSLGVTLYEMLTGALPFTAADPMEWVHCHIARQPMPPTERVKHVPVPVSAIILKLLAKTAEERYQTTAGLEQDLRCCLAQFEAEGRIDDFALGEHDTPDRLLVPEKLYGRARETESLLAAFDRIVQGGPPELVLVSGYSGIGKSAVVNELHRVLMPRGGTKTLCSSFTTADLPIPE